ncbi:hypothetical protein FTUN_7659 [Frigoriglobus tundricola]|uniref:Uncharacterized protein n=1 Tax=Frigoriglobus tundricola TaxID=2774151 RepID=A0A6M5Z2S9_9BACT|nr:hypothetical protein FTUN_7659 [Frigoriglobus tundricola]
MVETAEFTGGFRKRPRDPAYARPKNEVPTYKLHKSADLARCWANGKWVGLGKFGSPESKVEFERILAELRSGRRSWISTR